MSKTLSSPPFVASTMPLAPLQRNRAARPLPHRRQLLIVDDNAFFCTATAALLDHEPDLLVSGTAASGAALDVQLARRTPDLMVMDLFLGPESGLSLAVALRRRGVATPFFFTSSLATPPLATLRAIGRCAFWRKGGDEVGFLRGVRQLLARCQPEGSSTPVTPRSPRRQRARQLCAAQ